METKFKKIDDLKEIEVPLGIDESVAIDEQWLEEHFNEKDSTDGLTCIYKITNIPGYIIMISRGGIGRTLDCKENGIEQISDFNNGYVELVKDDGERWLMTIASQRFLPLDYKSLLDAAFVNPLSIENIPREKLFYDLDSFLGVGTLSLQNTFYNLKNSKSDGLGDTFTNLMLGLQLQETNRKYKAIASYLRAECEESFKSISSTSSTKWWKKESQREQIVKKLGSDNIDIIELRSNLDSVHEDAKKLIDEYLEEHTEYVIDGKNDEKLLDEASKNYIEIMLYNNIAEDIINNQLSPSVSHTTGLSPKNLNSYVNRVVALTKALEEFGLTKVQDVEDFLPVLKAKGLVYIEDLKDNGQFINFLMSMGNDIKADIKTFFEEFNKGKIDNKLTKLDKELGLLD